MGAGGGGGGVVLGKFSWVSLARHTETLHRNLKTLFRNYASILINFILLDLSPVTVNFQKYMVTLTSPFYYKTP